MSKLTIYPGDCLRSMAAMPAGSVHCVVTSPPYWGLRDYKIEPVVWGPVGQCGGGTVGQWENCDHEWGTGKKTAPITHWNSGGKAVRKVVQESGVSGSFCVKCNAWRGSHGSEPTIDLYLAHAVEIFRAVRRVLHDSGTLWLNIGDSYAAGGLGAGSGKQRTNPGSCNGEHVEKPRKAPPGLKPKDLCLIPERLALALQADGWYVRSRIAWCKKAPMPESVTDRPTGAWEHIWMLSKRERYFYDAEAVKEKSSEGTHARRATGWKTPDGWDTTAGNGSHGSFHKEGREKGRTGYKAKNGSLATSATRKLAEHGADGTKNNNSFDEAMCGYVAAQRNQRNFWLLGPDPYREAHYATFPREIPKRAILAGTSARGCCPQCLAPWERVMGGEPDRSNWNGSKFDDGKTLEVHPNIGKKRESAKTASQYEDGSTAKRLALLRQQARENGAEYAGGKITLGWQPTCKCGAADSEVRAPIPCTVFDPFLGSGTTAAVALELGRAAVGCEMNPEYIKLANRRCHTTPGLALA